MSKFLYPVDTDQFADIRKDAIECDGVEVGEDEFNISCEQAETPLPLFYQSGYLTIDRHDSMLRTYTLHYPNLEVRNGMVSGLMPLIQKRTTADGNSLIRKMAASVFDGNISGSLVALRAYIAKIPYEAEGRKVTRCGVSISSEARNITHWRIVDEEDNIVDEQVFC